MVILLPKLQDEDKWVMKSASASFNPVKLHESIQTLYLQEYERNWRRFSEAVRLMPRADSAVIAREGMSFELAMLHELASDASPLRNLLETIVDETSLTESDSPPILESALSGSGNMVVHQAQKVKGTMALREIQQVRYYVDDHFSELRMFVKGHKNSTRNREYITQQQGTALNHLLASLRDQYTRISVFNTMSNEDDSPIIFSDSAKLAAQAPGWPLPVRNIILPLLDSSFKKVRHSAVVKNVENISQGPGEICRTTLEGRYPFADSERTVSLSQFERFFGRDGIADSWFREHLAEKVDTSRHPWRFKGSENAQGLAFFEQAAVIREAFFPDETGKKMALAFSVSVPRLSSQITQLAFNIDGAVMRYSHGPVLVEQHRWPGKRQGELVSMATHRQQGAAAMPDLIFRGPWALLRWLDSADDLRPGENGSNTYTWHFGAGLVSLKIDGLSYNGRPLNDLLRRFQCPAPSKARAR
ncbi:hypothetical protein GWD52_06350 [Enterobacteriaceae bacterium 4M9]|nr:hypothetical protein [Enterobacteriaceae bacterium 4M9]